jgi:transposase
MRQRSSYPKPFKAQVVQECLQPGAKISSVAIHHGINANVIRKWLPIGAAKPHCAYLFANRRANRMKVLVHDGDGIWLAARRLNQGKFHWPGLHRGTEVELDPEQLHTLAAQVDVQGRHPKQKDPS